MSWGGRKVRRLARLVVMMHGPICCLCGGAIDLTIPRTDPRGLTVEHRLPRSAGGTDDPANLWPAHRRCNEQRGARPIEAGRRGAGGRVIESAPGFSLAQLGGSPATSPIPPKIC